MLSVNQAFDEYWRELEAYGVGTTNGGDVEPINKLADSLATNLAIFGWVLHPETDSFSVTYYTAFELSQKRGFNAVELDIARTLMNGGVPEHSLIQPAHLSMKQLIATDIRRPHPQFDDRFPARYAYLLGGSYREVEAKPLSKAEVNAILARGREAFGS